MLRFINKQFFNVSKVKEGKRLHKIQTAAFLAGKTGTQRTFANAIVKNSDNDFNRFNDNVITTFVERKDKNTNLLTVTSDASKDPSNFQSKEIVLVALPFDGIVVGPQEFDGYQILKALCVKSEGGHNINFNNRKFGNVMYLAIEVNKDVVAGGEYNLEIPFSIYTTHRENGKSVENSWHKLNVKINISDKFMFVKYGDSVLLENFDINTVRTDGIKVMTPSPRKTLSYK